MVTFFRHALFLMFYHFTSFKNYRSSFLLFLLFPLFPLFLNLEASGGRGCRFRSFEETLETYRDTFKRVHWGAIIRVTHGQNYGLIKSENPNLLPNRSYVILQLQLLREDEKILLGVQSLTKERTKQLWSLSIGKLSALSLLENRCAARSLLQAPLPLIGDFYQQDPDEGGDSQGYIIGIGELPELLKTNFCAKEEKGWLGALVILSSNRRDPAHKDKKLIITQPYFIPEKFSSLTLVKSKKKSIEIGMKLNAGLNFLKECEKLLRAMQQNKNKLSAPLPAEKHNALLISYTKSDHLLGENEKESQTGICYLKGGLTFEYKEGRHEARGLPYLFLAKNVDSEVNKGKRHTLTSLKQLEENRLDRPSPCLFKKKLGDFAINFKIALRTKSNELAKEDEEREKNVSAHRSLLSPPQRSRYLTLYPVFGVLVPQSPLFKVGEMLPPRWHTGFYRKNRCNKRGTPERKKNEQEAPFMKSVIGLPGDLFLSIEDGFFHYWDTSFQERMRSIKEGPDHFAFISTRVTTYLFVKASYAGLFHGDDDNRSYALFCNKAKILYTQRDGELLRKHRDKITTRKKKSYVPPNPCTNDNIY